jgi:hypothetical protein
MYELTLCLSALLLAATGAAAVPVETTDDPRVVSVDNVRVIIDRDGTNLDVTQFIRLRSVPGKSFAGGAGFPILLPRGATAPMPIGEEKIRIKIFKNRVVIDQPIGPEGLVVSLRYNLPIRDGQARFEQQFGRNVAVAQVFSTWTADEATLVGRDFTGAEARELSSGLMALAIFSQDLPGGDLDIALTGLTDGPQRMRTLVTFVLSILMLVSGLAFWIRERVVRGRRNPTNEAG